MSSTPHSDEERLHILPIPNTHFVSVELPAVVNDVERAVKSIGGRSSVFQSATSDSRLRMI
jgi:hypothetical protein